MAARVYKKEKTEAIAAIKDWAEKSNIKIVTDHQGMSVKQITKLRNKLFAVNAQYTVVKNTLTLRAVKKEEAELLKDVMNGASSIIFGYEDVVAPAKILMAFIKENEKPAVKGAIMDGRLLGVAEIKKLASLPTRNVLIAQVIGGIKSPLYSLVSVVQGPIRKLVYALNEISKKKGV